MMPGSDEAFRTYGQVGNEGQRTVEPLSGTVTFLFTDVEGSTRLWRNIRRPCPRPWPATTRS
jgi:class 3 adenylate cyclase